MKVSYYKENFRRIIQDSLCDDSKIHHLCSRIALSFLDRYYYNDEFATDYILLLSEIAASKDLKISSAGSSALFGIVIESLCDDFEELQTEAYNRVMSIVIDFCRKIPEGSEMDLRLKKFGLDSVEKIYSRIEKLRHNALKTRDLSKAKKIVILSRVTIGADVSVTSTIIQRLWQISPSLDIVLIGDPKLKSIFGGNERLKFRALSYSRRGGLIARVSTWHDVLDIVSEEKDGFAKGECILLDTDSRLSQLGVLPIVSDDEYLFFRSRGDLDLFPKKLSMAELVNAWADMVFGKSDFVYPKIWLPKSTLKKAETLCARIKKSGSEKIISVNFGVGGNPRKRLEAEFETSLLKRLLEDGKNTVILDKGFGADELSRTDAIIAKLHEYGIRTFSSNFETFILPEDFACGLIGLNAEIGDAASIIAASDLYIGYDSACQHIAAASEIPTITVFAGTNNTRFVRRWRAFGKAKSEIIHADTLSKSVFFETADIIERVIEATKE